MYKHLAYCCAVFFIMLCGGNKAFAQNDSTHKPPRANRVFAARFLYGSVIAHSIYIKNTEGAHPKAIAIDISKQLTDSITFQKYGCYPRMGFTATYSDFDTKILGHAAGITYFMEPHFRISNKASIFLKAASGFGYLSSPSDSIKNPANQTYSLHINIYSQVAAGFSYRLSDHIAADMSVGFEHYSNGNLREPNRGLNWYHLGVGLRYTAQNNSLPAYSKTKDTSWKQIKHAIDIGIFYSPKEGYKPDFKTPARKVLTGVHIQVSKMISNISALSIAGEVYYDGALANIKKHINDSSSSVLAGIMAGHEFVFRKFIFSQQLGIYIHKHTQTYSERYRQPFEAIYHRWGLRYRVTPHWYIGINMLARKNVADFIDGRLLYRL